jgi:hypothetical protein
MLNKIPNEIGDDTISKIQRYQKGNYLPNERWVEIYRDIERGGSYFAGGNFDIIEYYLVAKSLNPNGEYYNELREEMRHILSDEDLSEFDARFERRIEYIQQDIHYFEDLTVSDEYMALINKVKQRDFNSAVDYLTLQVGDRDQARSELASRVLSNKIDLPGLDFYYSNLLSQIIYKSFQTDILEFDEEGNAIGYEQESLRQFSTRFWKNYFKLMNSDDIIYLSGIGSPEKLIVPSDFDPKKILRDLSQRKTNKYLPRENPEKFRHLLEELSKSELVKRPDFSSKL